MRDLLPNFDQKTLNKTLVCKLNCSSSLSARASLIFYFFYSTVFSLRPSQKDFHSSEVNLPPSVTMLSTHHSANAPFSARTRAHTRTHTYCNNISVFFTPFSLALVCHHHLALGSPNRLNISTITLIEKKACYLFNDV